MKQFLCKKCNRIHENANSVVHCCSPKDIFQLKDLTNADKLKIGDFVVADTQFSYWANNDDRWIYEKISGNYQKKFVFIYMVVNVSFLAGRNKYTFRTNAVKEAATYSGQFVKFQDELSGIKIIDNPTGHLIESGKEILNKFSANEFEGYHNSCIL